MSGYINGAGSRSGVIGQTEIDYEEGTFTGDAKFGGSSGTSNGTATGYYRKIGDLCWLRCVVNLASTKAGSGSLFITGLPFTSTSTTDCAGIFSTADYCDANRVDAVIPPNQAHAQFYIMPGSTGGTLAAFGDGPYQNSVSGKTAGITFVYQTA
jgi:hypothetical protein